MTTRTRSHTHKGKRWSRNVTAHSHALDLEENVFTQDDPRAIARSLKHSAERSHSRNATPFRSAMSMLTFYINRAGSQLSERDAKKLESTKEELRRLFRRDNLAKASEQRAARRQ